MIEKEEKGNKKIYTLKDEDKRLVIDVNPGKEDVAYINSSSFDFLDIVDKENSREEIQATLEEELDLRTEGKTQVAGVFSDKFSIVLFEGSELYAGEKWSEEELQLYP